MSEILLRDYQAERLRSALQRSLNEHRGWADLWNARGMLHAFDGEFEAARVAFQEALSRGSGFALAQWNLAWVELLLGRADAARSVACDGTRDLPQPGALLHVVTRMLANRTPDPESSPEHPSLAFSLAAAFAARGEDTLARRMIGRVGLRDGGLPQLLQVAELGSPERPDIARLAELGRPRMLNPGYADLLARAATLEAASGRPSEALRLCALAALLRGNRAYHLLRRAEICGSSESALSDLREAANIDPTWYAPHAALAYDLSLRGLRDEALLHAEIATRLEPRYADLLYQHGLLLHAASRDDEARDMMVAALRINPRYHVAGVALANLHFEAGREALALPHYEAVLAEGLESPILLGRFGYAAHAAGHRARAEELFLTAIARDRDRAEVLCLYGLFLAETDRKVEARALWDRALATDPPPDLRQRIESLRSGAERR
jgi:tetratricopeptide (TPR) repeat protein